MAKSYDFSPFLFPSSTANSYPQLSLPSSSSSSPLPPSFYSNSYSTDNPSSPSLNSPFQNSNQNLPQPTNSQTSSSSAAAFGPCAACKILGRRCTDKCYLASYFPSGEPDKFTVVDALLGASDIVNFLQQNSNSSYIPLLFLLKDSRSEDHGAFQLAPPQQELIFPPYEEDEEEEDEEDEEEEEDDEDSCFSI